MKALLGIKNFPLYFMLLLFFTQCTNAPTDGGLFLPEGFGSAVVIDSIEETVRHLAVSDDNIIYAKLRNASENGVAVALKDTDGDVRANRVEKFGSTKKEKWSYATAMRIYNGYIYYRFGFGGIQAKIETGLFASRRGGRGSGDR